MRLYALMKIADPSIQRIPILMVKTPSQSVKTKIPQNSMAIATQPRVTIFSLKKRVENTAVIMGAVAIMMLAVAGDKVPDPILKKVIYSVNPMAPETRINGISFRVGNPIRLLITRMMKNSDAQIYLSTPMDEGEKYSSAIFVNTKADDQSRMVPMA